MFPSLFFKNIFVQYLIWHYYDVSREILKGWRNFLKFNINYFSLPFLFKTLFSYWRRYKYSYGSRFDPKRYFEAFTFNLMSRTIGALVRIGLIFCGVLIEIFIFLSGAILFLLWLFLPFLLIFGFFFGISRILI